MKNIIPIIDRYAKYMQKCGNICKVEDSGKQVYWLGFVFKFAYSYIRLTIDLGSPMRVKMSVNCKLIAFSV